jgi:molecular chaperone GrpE
MRSDDQTAPPLAAMPDHSHSALQDSADQPRHGNDPSSEAAEHESQPGAVPEVAARPGDAIMAAFGDLTARLAGIEEQLAEFHRRSAHREQVIDRLHEENQRLRGGLSKAILEPVVTDLIRLFDQVDREVRRLRADGKDERLLWSFADDIAQILDRCGIGMYSAEPGDPFDRDRHRPLAVVACADKSQHNTMAEMITVGFTERETGRIRRPVQARFYQYIPVRESMPDGSAAQA